MRGFGDPTDLGALTGVVGFDWGFGSPSPDPFSADQVDWGFGDPSPTSLLVIARAQGQNRALPDEGGVIVRLESSWPDAGPYRVQFRHVTTGRIYPDPALHLGCKAPVSVTPGGRAPARPDPWACMVSRRAGGGLGRALDFIMPPMPPGSYDLILTWGPEVSREVRVLADAFRVVWRARSQAFLVAKSGLPPIYNVGARTVAAEVVYAKGQHNTRGD